MRSTIWNYVRGYAEAEVIGERLEEFINRAAASHSVWNVERTSPNSLKMTMDLKTYFQLRPLLRETGCRIRAGRRAGLPFLLRRLKSRLFFAAGFVFFILGLIMLSQLIWQVEVEGNELIMSDKVYAEAEKLGIRPLQWKFRLDEPQRLAAALTRSLEGAAWVGVDVRGTRVLIQIVEQTAPEPRKLSSPRHLVSQYDAVITDMFAVRGKPVVRVNSKVKKGDLLISGWIGDETSGAAVVAEGSVRGLVWHEYTIASPLVHRHKVYTGESKTRRYAVIGNRALQLSGYGKLTFEQYESHADRKTLAWRGRKLPLGWIREQLKEVRTEQAEVSEEDAREIGLMHARADIMRKAGDGAKITAQNILHEKIEGGKVYMKALFEVEQNIAKEVPIVQGE